jgi:hypothetical protein
MENVPVMRHNDEGRAPYTRVCDVARKICPDRRAAGLFVTGGGVQCEADGTPAPHAIPFCRHSRESGNPFDAADGWASDFLSTSLQTVDPRFRGDDVQLTATCGGRLVTGDAAALCEEDGIGATGTPKSRKPALRRAFVEDWIPAFAGMKQWQPR